MKSQKAICAILVSVLFLILSLTAFGSTAVGKSPVVDLAIMGYDPVEYFKTGNAKKGTESFTFQWHDKTWYFSSKENRDLFSTSPERYAPQYDGYCAWAMAEARKAQSDPEVWKIFNGKLYLNCSKTAYEKWSKDIPGNINKANKNWLKL